MTQSSLTLFVAGIGIAGSLGGVIVGQRMSRSWEREQWVLDCRVREFRELLDALADGLRVSMTMYAGASLDEQKQREIIQVHSNVMRVIRSRIFIIKEVLALNVEVRWSEAVNEHRKTLYVEPLATAFNEIRVHLVNAAHASLKTRPESWYRKIWPLGRKRPANVWL